MISQANGSAVRSAYTSTNIEARETAKKDMLNISKQGDTSKVEQLKTAIESGEYKVDLQALSQKIAEELL